jgi:hypothetical protein
MFTWRECSPFFYFPSVVRYDYAQKNTVSSFVDTKKTPFLTSVEHICTNYSCSLFVQYLSSICPVHVQSILDND